MRIDAHHHFWQYNPVRDSWITPEMAVLRHDFLPTEFKGILDSHHLEGSIVVQADQSEVETDFLTGFAETNTYIKGVVGWIDLQNHHLEEKLQQAHPKVVGYRHIVQAEPAGFLSNQEFIKGVQVLGKYQMTYDLLIYPHQMPEALTFLPKVTGTTLVLDHMAKPTIRSGAKTTWELDLAAMATFDNLYCKISGLTSEAGRQNWTKEKVYPYLDEVLECFGTNRIMFGSDWPVCLVESDYSQQLELISDYFDSFSKAEKSAFFGGNASRIYNLKNGTES